MTVNNIETPVLREDLWNAWVERGRANARAGKRRMRIVAIFVAGAVAVASATFSIFGRTGA